MPGTKNKNTDTEIPSQVVAEPPVTSVPRSDSQDQQPGGQLADAATTPAAEPAPMPATVNPETTGGEIDYGTSGTTAPVSMVTEELAQQSQKEEKKGGGALWMIIGILIGLAAGGAAGYGVANWRESQQSSTAEVQEKTGSTEETAAGKTEPTPTPGENEPERENLTLQVLNGSGVKGAAGKAMEYLENLGYKDVETGNADKSDYVETEIRVKASKKEFKNLLKEDLKTEYELADSEETLPETAEFDAVIVIGQQATEDE